MSPKISDINERRSWRPIKKWSAKLQSTQSTLKRLITYSNSQLTNKKEDSGTQTLESIPCVKRQTGMPCNCTERYLSSPLSLPPIASGPVSTPSYAPSKGPAWQLSVYLDPEPLHPVLGEHPVLSSGSITPGSDWRPYTIGGCGLYGSLCEWSAVIAGWDL